jgi:hypothetical protein
MPFFSTFYGIEVRDEITQEFTDSSGNVDDMMAGLHEIRARLAEEDPWLKQLHNNLKKVKRKKSGKNPDKSLIPV